MHRKYDFWRSASKCEVQHTRTWKTQSANLCNAYGQANYSQGLDTISIRMQVLPRSGTYQFLKMADKAIQKGYTKRYLPEKAWASLSKEERAETDQKKRTGSRQGKQFIPNTDKAKKAGRAARRYRDSK
jgi:hypothetical protein